MKRALLYRRGGLGDTLLTFPVAEVLNRLGYQVVFLGHSDYLCLARHCGWAQAIYSGEFLNYFLSQPFEKKIIISLEGNLKPFPKERIWLPIYYLQSLGLPLDFSSKLPFSEYVPKDKRLAFIHPGSGSPKKNPTFSLFRKIERLLRDHQWDVLYIAGEAEKWLIGKVDNLLILRDTLSLAKTLAQGKIYVGNDSGVSHLASFLGLKSFIFFGPSDELVFRPIGEKITIISLPLSCRPCFPYTCEERVCLEEEALWEAFIEAFTREEI